MSNARFKSLVKGAGDQCWRWRTCGYAGTDLHSVFHSTEGKHVWMCATCERLYHATSEPPDGLEY